MTKYTFALSVFACLLTMTADALAQLSLTTSASRAADASALKTCREKIASSWGAGSTKMRQVQPLPGASIRFQPTFANTSMGPDSVRASNVRLFRARVQGTNFLGMPLDFYAVCFFEERGRSHRFIQICTTKGLTSDFSGCNFSWLMSDALYDASLKNQSGSR